MYPQFYYVEINCVSLLLIFWLIAQYKKNIDKQTGNVMFIRVVYATMFIMFLDIIQAYLDGRPGRTVFILNNILNVVYLPLSGLISLFWFTYVFCDIVPGKQYIKWRPFFVLPSVLLTVCSLVSPWTHWIFYIDSTTNYYRHGDLYIIQQVVTYAYFIISSFMALLSLLHEKDEARRSRLLTIFSFIVLPFISGIVDILLPGFEVTWPAITVSLLFVFSELQLSQISVDALTGLSHRRHFTNYIETKLRPDSTGSAKYYMFMMDIDLFKEINDTFGHLEGDAALVETASLLRNVFSAPNTVLARYGGDEFAVVCLCRDDAAARALRLRLYCEFEQRNRDGHSPYTLMVSAGFAGYSGTGSGAVVEMMRQADKSLYEEKRMHHILRHN
ncbi:MAG: diguanylate cyclase [Treponema sp.]|nr:diguanylate cyclase [Treponema sp.]